MSSPNTAVDAQDTNTITATSQIKKVVLFSDRAQVFRTGKVGIKKAGDYTITFDGLWNSVNRDTLQVATSPVVGASVILRSVQFTTINDIVDVRPRRRELDDKIKALEEPIRNVQDEIELAERAMNHFTSLKEKLTSQMRSANKGSPFVYDTKLWNEFNDFIKNGTVEHRTKKRDAERRKADLDKEKSDLELARTRLGSSNTKCTSREVAEVILSVLTDKPNQEVELDMMLSYMVTGCSWTPSYDIRIDKAAKSMNVTYNAVVQQRAGEDWKDVRLELSTAKAHVGGEIPDFTTPWYLKKKEIVHYEEHVQELAGGLQQNFMMNNMMMQQMMPTSAAAAAPSAPGAGGGGAPSRRAFKAASTTAAQINNSSSTSVTFTIQALSTVLADNEPVKVTIAMFDLPVHFRYSAVPKLDPNCYLKVRATNDTDFPLLKGKSNIFADEQLVGRSEMDDVAPAEDFWCFLGVAGDVNCTRKELSKKHVDVGGGFLGKDKKRIEYSYKFTCKNVKPTTEELVVWDQMPIADDTKIVVSLVTPKPENEGKEVDGSSNHPFFKINESKFIEWFVNLKSGEERTFEYTFHVEHPAENQITI